MKLPLITSASHNSHDFRDFKNRVALDDWHIKELSDEYTGTTAYHPDALGNCVAHSSRGICDLNRPRIFSSFAKKDFLNNPIWKEGKGLTDEEKEQCFDTIYDPYYDEIKSLIKLSKDKSVEKVILWDQHDTGDYNPDSKKRDRNMPRENRVMPKFILSNFGLENTGEINPEKGYTTCPPKFIQAVQQLVADEFDIKTHDIKINTSYKGGNIIQHFGNPKNDFGNKVVAIQVEYNRGMIMDQATREPYKEKIKEMNLKFREVMKKSCKI